MKMLSLKLRDPVFREVETIVRAIHVSRNAYINDALAIYNEWNKRKLLKAQLRKESKAVRQNSLDVLSEYEKLEDGLEK